LATIAADGTVLDTWFPAPELASDVAASGTTFVTAAEASAALNAEVALSACSVRNTTVVAVRTEIKSLADAPADTHDAYLRLHLLSHRLVQPHGANVAGIFGLLANVAWTNLGPCAIAEVPAARLRARASGRVLEVKGVDKFPQMTDYVIPAGVRIANADRVRLGAHLASGTTVMHEGFCNFNAGTLGASMVEGRISAGVVVDDASDIGGGASIMGTLSGGGKEVIRVGKRCLLGANAGIGISLGDDCVVEAGCYITGGSRVQLPDGSVIKAKDLSGKSNLLFRRDSQTGALHAIPRLKSWGELNAELHKN
ncbi:MAG: 2,3,4,5-tetrahydropyridine-2,6-dicarboxylate N-succinyltransferase, partial [Pseudomonadota bacterium]